MTKCRYTIDGSRELSIVGDSRNYIEADSSIPFGIAPKDITDTA
jgi:hypothetical protein